MKKQTKSKKNKSRKCCPSKKIWIPEDARNLIRHPHSIRYISIHNHLLVFELVNGDWQEFVLPLNKISGLLCKTIFLKVGKSYVVNHRFLIGMKPQNGFMMANLGCGIWVPVADPYIEMCSNYMLRNRLKSKKYKQK